MKLSYAITTHNEYEEINELLGVLVHHIDPKKDEIVILDDYSDEKTQEVFKSWTSQYGDHINFKIEQRALNKNFAEQKNYLTRMCSGDYIINIDADEIPHDVFLNQIRQVIEINEVDLIWVPRVNTVDGITQEHINKWGWQVNEKGWVNFPDYQGRIWKNRTSIRWEKPVHETLVGYKEYTYLPMEEQFAFYHPKDIDRQEKQNEFYGGI